MSTHSQYQSFNRLQTNYIHYQSN